MAKEKKSAVLAEHDVQRLSDYQHARIRTEMYLGSREEQEQPVLIFGENGYEVKNVAWVPALLTAFREIVDNSLDEFTKARTKDATLRVQYNEDTLEFEISDNGRGIPIDYVPEFGKHLCTMVMSETKTGRNFDDSQRKGTSGQNGLGGSITMCVSAEAEIEIHRAGRPYKTDKANDEYTGMYKFNQKFKEGNEFFPEMIIEEPTIRKVKADKTGTTIRYRLNTNEVFRKSQKLPTELVYSILKEISVANPDYKIFLNDKRIQAKGTVEKCLFGVSKAMSLVVQDNEFYSTFYVVPNSVKEQAMNLHMHGIVNNVPSFDAGTHLDTFKKNFALGVIKSLEKESKKKKLYPNRSDIEEGLLIYNITTMNAPYFASQTKTKLINEEVVKPITSAMSTDYFDDLVKRNKTWIEEIYARCAERTNKKDAEEDRKAAKKLLRGKVAKLVDATSKDRMSCSLFIAEGNSAAGSISGSRDSKIHGILPLRGKIKNVTGNEKVSTIMESEALKDIMSSLNLIPGQKAVRSELNYGRIFIATDEDLDGYNIAALLNNFFYKFWPELYEDENDPFIYVFKTPFIILEKGKESNYFYGHNYNDYKPEEWTGWKARRAKGLGTLQKKDWDAALSNMYCVAITESNGELGKVLELLFNDNADDRKEWMADK